MLFKLTKRSLDDKPQNIRIRSFSVLGGLQAMVASVQNVQIEISALCYFGEEGTVRAYLVKLFRKLREKTPTRTGQEGNTITDPKLTK